MNDHKTNIELRKKAGASLTKNQLPVTISLLGEIVKNNEIRCLRDVGIVANRVNTCKINDIVWVHKELRQ